MAIESTVNSRMFINGQNYSGIVNRHEFVDEVTVFDDETPINSDTLVNTEGMTQATFKYNALYDPQQFIEQQDNIKDNIHEYLYVLSVDSDNSRTRRMEALDSSISWSRSATGRMVGSIDTVQTNQDNAYKIGRMVHYQEEHQATWTSQEFALETNKTLNVMLIEGSSSNAQLNVRVLAGNTPVHTFTEVEDIGTVYSYTATGTNNVTLSPQNVVGEVALIAWIG